MHRDLDLVMFRMMEDTFNWENDEEFHLLQSYITRFVTINNVCQILGDGAQILTLLLTIPISEGYKARSPRER
jgi:hypothetical protein